MSHSISIYLIRKEDLRDSKLESILEDKKIGIKFKELGSNILATTRIPNIKEFGINKTIAKIETDYFGGSGNQSAKLFVNNEKVYDKSDEQDWSAKPINDVLKEMGVQRISGQDEFDTIGLGNYRTNMDFN
jgi:hypothetical protein